MKNRRWFQIAAFFPLLVMFIGLSSTAQQNKVTVLNPLGQPPAIERVPMAPRIDNLEGKTIYIVDTGFTDTHQLFTEMQQLLEEKYPRTTWIVRKKIGTYFENDPNLWNEIKEKGHGMIMGVGH